MWKFIYIKIGAIFETAWRIIKVGFDLDKVEEKIDEDLINIRRKVWRLKQGKK
jgi:hypothetical protein